MSVPEVKETARGYVVQLASVASNLEARLKALIRAWCVCRVLCQASLPVWLIFACPLGGSVGGAARSTSAQAQTQAVAGRSARLLLTAQDAVPLVRLRGLRGVLSEVLSCVCPSLPLPLPSRAQMETLGEMQPLLVATGTRT